MENVESVSLPPGAHFVMTVKNSVGEDVREGVVIDPGEQHDLDNSRGTANFCLKWDRSAKHQAYLNVEAVKGVTRDIKAEDADKFVPVMGFECRGLEPVSYQPGVFIVKSRGGQTFEADLSEGEWADFDEKLGESVSIMGVESSFTTHKK
ncbi:hypothetical protein CHLNCDRAFT_143180 [Chlorella variabilis]|uniref:DUF866 domain-containing protein n=1 Tax=Chlorella variabilis TaxID=554065 RepID=E1Z9M9_CHLVA|nr:hypothetical protein CHLNCDRAFT_143180 [Chlorella variabilis]EFN57803.1 hypothetical protein CHLNCDRAFT_143180 [Chlorella variabilis]|eukprot:XP_005849905.1 hypothetical protein CHLNCDRAFT_143180 [Chlorella variabilis]